MSDDPDAWTHADEKRFMAEKRIRNGVNNLLKLGVSLDDTLIFVSDTAKRFRDRERNREET